MKVKAFDGVLAFQATLVAILLSLSLMDFVIYLLNFILNGR